MLRKIVCSGAFYLNNKMSFKQTLNTCEIDIYFIYNLLILVRESSDDEEEFNPNLGVIGSQEG